ncbi:small ribosomal subunit Rsm22 family protein [Streptomyces sp. NBC_00448]|uniref:small ribosomal subunit Rsm22 family protein n=1 Tax=Streptomyces sp. NBC_00448 TaxID=2903652 RepID=UPI003FA7B16F
MSLVPTVHLPDDLAAALTRRLAATAPTQASAQVDRLIEHYRGATPTAAPVLRDAADAAAYAAYRMPATYAAARSALAALHVRTAGWTPATHLDLGGGTGAARWAVGDVWPGADGPAGTVLDWSAAALDLGRALAADSATPSVRATTWTRAPLSGAPALPAADLVTVSYVLGELTPGDRAALVEAAAAATRPGGVALVAEPGTPDGYARIIGARDRLVAAGFTVLAPCPHSGPCPVTGTDWCHFAARVHRSALHRQVKGGTLPYEDEKFSYVAAARPAGPGDSAGSAGSAEVTGSAAVPAANRIVRHPQTRKGQVLLDLCAAAGDLTRTTVSKRQGPLYREARDACWGDPWPPDQPPAGPDPATGSADPC